MAPRLPFRVPNVGPRTRKILRYVGLTVFSILVFVFALQATFPYARVRDKVVEALSDKYEVTIGGVDRGIMPGRVYFTAVTLRTRQTKAEETVTTFFIKKIEIDAGILSLIGGTISVDVDAEIGAGRLSGSVAIGKFGRGDIHAHFTGEHLPGDALPMRGLLGLPLTGKIEFDVAINLPMEKSKLGKTGINWPKATGSFSLGCPAGCTFGDGHTKLKPLLKNTRNQVMVGEGIDFGKVTMDSLIAKATMKSGKLTVDRFETKSKDGELKVDYTMQLEKDFDESMVTGCLRFKGSDDLLKREPKTYAAIQTTGAELRGDGLFHIRLTDRFKDMKRLNQECGPNVASTSGSGGDSGGGRNERPTMTVQPNEVSRQNVGSAMTAPPTAPVPTPMEAPSPATITHDAGVGSATGGPAGPAGPATPLPPGALPDGNGSSGTMSNDVPRERELRDQRERQNRMEPPAGSGDSAGSSSGSAVTPPIE